MVPDVSFLDLTEAQLRRWVEANPGRVNHRDCHIQGFTPLIAAAWKREGLSLVVWLLDEKGADVNATMGDGRSADSLDILTALMDRGADVTMADCDGVLPLMDQANKGTADTVARLLQDPRVRATVNMQDGEGNTALYHVCEYETNLETEALKAQLLLQAGADPTITINYYGLTFLGFVRQYSPSAHATIVLLERAIADGETTSLLVKARCLVAANNAGTTPSHLQGRLAQGLPLPSLALLPVIGGGGDDDDEAAARKLRILMAFLLGMEGGPRNTGMPRDVFRDVMDLLMPMWDPLRRKAAGAGPPLPQG